MSAPSTEKRSSGREAWPALFVGLTSLAAYLLTLAPTVASNDAGRFQTASPLLGIGHPTGYPTFIIFGKLFTLLPLGDVAYRVNLMAAVFGGMAAVLLYLVCRGIGAARIPAAGSALVFAFSATFWSQATLGEVYTMNAFFALLITLLLLRWRGSGSASNIVLAAFVYGVSFGNNAGMVLFGPMFLVLLISGGKGRITVARLLSGAAALLAGLSVYAYVPLRGFTGAWSNYGDPVNDWEDVWTVVSGARFQGLMDPSFGTVIGNLGGFLYQFSAQAPEPFGYALLGLLAVGGTGGGIRLFIKERGARPVAVAFGLGLAATLLYALSYEIDDIAVYYIPVYMILSVLLSVGVSGAGRLKFARPRAAVVPVFAAALVLGLNFAPSDRSQYYEERTRSEDILRALPEDAVLYGKVEIIPVTYLTEVEDDRPDVTLRWLDGGTIEDRFAGDIEGGRPVYFISSEVYNEDYLPATEEFATSTGEDGLIAFEPL